MNQPPPQPLPAAWNSGPPLPPPPLPPPPLAPPAEPAAGPTAPGRAPTPQLYWGTGHGGVQAVSVWTERVPGRGEDAEPFVVHHWESMQGLLAVFDGSGGAGAAPAWQAPDGTARTGAWVGARTARLATDCWFHDVARDRQDADAQSLHAYVKYFLEQAPKRQSKISGTMRRQLPTTLAGLHYEVGEGETEIAVRPLWTGDSRAYALLPHSGLQVLTRDHTRESDALELLRSDPPMTNLVCADREFEVATHRLTLPLPCVLVAATDGFFGYVHTPGEFELLLLRTLERAHDALEWSDLLRREVQAYTADDASLALLALGHRDFADLRDRFAPRYRELTDQLSVGRPGVLNGAPDPGADPREAAAGIKAWQDRTWQAYRHDYERHLPPAPEEAR
ncbi:serine/threonine protein phosphatase [Streptomyces sp. NPDC057694]|uniref:serine/threonine protein phosphatase n=1 Tax=Streptomyces sp. NPDC057694 TaxID=3346216 RepID=UPI0036880898